MLIPCSAVQADIKLKTTLFGPSSPASFIPPLNGSFIPCDPPWEAALSYSPEKLYKKQSMHQQG